MHTFALVLYSVIFRSVIFQSCKFSYPVTVCVVTLLGLLFCVLIARKISTQVVFNTVSYSWPFLGPLFDGVHIVKPVSNVRPYVRPYVHKKFFFDFSDI